MEGNKKIVIATSAMYIFARTLWDKGIQVHGAFWISDGSHYPKSNSSGMYMVSAEKWVVKKADWSRLFLIFFCKNNFQSDGGN